MRCEAEIPREGKLWRLPIFRRWRFKRCPNRATRTIWGKQLCERHYVMTIQWLYDSAVEIVAERARLEAELKQEHLN